MIQNMEIMRKKELNLIYWNDQLNFGDQLSIFIVKHMLDGRDVRVVYKSGYKSYKFWCYYYLKKVFNCHMDVSLYMKPYEKSLLAIGSLLMFSSKMTMVWGSGFMNESDKYNGGRLFALRGKKTNQKIIQQGGKGCYTYGDPALLLPMFIKAPAEKKFTLGIVPHWKETDYFKNEYGNRFHVIDLRTDDIKNVVEEVTLCKTILSSSLHGIIVAHAYGIPALWIRKGYIDTDGFKFDDYFSSVNIKSYPGFTNYDEIIGNEVLRNYLFQQDISLPRVDLGQLRKNLINAFPYDEI